MLMDCSKWLKGGLEPLLVLLPGESSLPAARLQLKEFLQK